MGAGGGGTLHRAMAVCLALGWHGQRKAVLPEEGVRRSRMPVYLLLAMVLAVALSDMATRWLLRAFFPGYSPLAESLTDAAILTSVLTPPYYFLWYRPLKRQIAERLRSEEEVRRLSRELLVAGEEERRRLAFDLHDEFGPPLTALRWRLDLLRQVDAEAVPAAEREWERLMAEVSALGDKIRNVSTRLHPAILDDLGIVPALQWHIGNLRSAHPELSFDFAAMGRSKHLASTLEIVLFRTCQEALNNTLKHARASRAEIHLVFSHPRVILSVRDDGVGFVPPGAAGKEPAEPIQGIGLLGMRERAAAVGGIFSVVSSKGGGTLVRVELPTGEEL